MRSVTTNSPTTTISGAIVHAISSGAFCSFCERGAGLSRVRRKRTAAYRIKPQTNTATASAAYVKMRQSSASDAACALLTAGQL